MQHNKTGDPSDHRERILVKKTSKLTSIAMQEETWSEFGGSVAKGSECRGSMTFDSTLTRASDQAAVEARDQDLIRFNVWALGFMVQGSGFVRLLFKQGNQDFITEVLF